MRLVHDIVNTRPGDASRAFANRLLRDAPLDEVAVTPGLDLANGETGTLEARVGIPPGACTADVQPDAGNAVAETRENDSEFHVGYPLHRRDAGPRC